LAKVFGENWQEEYYIWDCCAGTCNLLAGLANPHRVWASTLEQPDVDIVHENIKQNEIYLLESHVFQFDFLNGDFKDLPKSLRNILNDKKKRKKLIIYMNPPYAEHGSTSAKAHKVGVAKEHQTKQWYKNQLGAAARELYAQLLMRIHEELRGCKIALFSKLKHLQANNFKQFRQNFAAKFLNGFLIPANTFDNVTGKFPIAFQIWDTEIQKQFRVITADIYNRENEYGGKKKIINVDHGAKITKWIKSQQVDARYDQNFEQDKIGRLNGGRTDFQNQNLVFIVHHQHPVPDAAGYYWIHKQNVIPTAIYFAVRHCIAADWLNDRDQFFAPNEGYQTDKEFQNDCLIFTLFHHQNGIYSKNVDNHWIPFTEQEVNAKDNFQSAFMSDFLKRRKLSKEAKAVFEAGKALWAYYHETIQTAKRALVDVSLYEIREYFKGRNENGKMKNKATDERFNELDAELRSALKMLAKKIQPKVYEYGFLKK
jgi:predicted RNA methylase